jgi:hypothetical protein
MASETARPKYCRTAVLGLLGFIPVFGAVLLALADWLYGAQLYVRVFGTSPPTVDPFTLLLFYGPSCCLFTLCFIGTLFTTLMGIVAIIQIRSTKGQLRGMGCALAEGVILPAISLLALVVCLLLFFG